MANFNNSLPAGILVDGIAPLQRVQNIIILAKGQTFVDVDDLKTKSTWRTKIASTLTCYVPSGLEAYEVTTPDPEVQTTAMGSNYIAGKAAPSLTAKLKSNLTDYQEILRTLNGGVYSVILVLEDGSIMARQKSTAKTIYGFEARLTAVSRGIPDPGAIGEFYSLFVHFVQYQQFEETIITTPVWNIYDLVSLMPNGLNMGIVTPYTTAGSKTVVVSVTSRDGSAFVGLIAADFVIIESNLTGCAIDSITDNTDGTYDIVIDDGSTGSLTATKYAILQVKNGSGTFTDVSNTLLIEGGA